ncbi:hypothetical protein OJ997_21805 [Solirubrobacter phytolaccae]|uniref:Uncharacterized protein n=1 Tax=Solirubrobacter phytolaccae TaxID=1404360 RepID=A0A9X3SCW1_9ACTN|nr:hypothetical protein [Solirubrobacter phytolaccae]MDA0182960.1 hypothetical protein [Solirubrobacter phytolaccae]
MDAWPDSTCECHTGAEAAGGERSDAGVVCLVCEYPCNLLACVEGNRRDAADVGESLIEGSASAMWLPTPKSRSELPRAD